ncbi:hypothetical protein LCGC14_1310390 [marine sediment metagenome]|uniref:Uncharacterized protein n=1 Tax=marine sediment metagenome TaxID=412755 RepID=A0A0F9L7J0_9ZZZZ|nr:hypothetical protein [Pricia sp.]
MAVVAQVRIGFKLTSLGNLEEWAEKYDAVTVATRKFKQYLVQATADAEEALSFGDIGTVTMLFIKCITNDVDVDLNYSSSFSADLTIQEGEIAVIPSPVGVVRIRNNDSGEQVTLEITAIGTA